MSLAPVFSKRAFLWAMGASLLAIGIPQMHMWWTTRGRIHLSLPLEKKQTALILGASVYGDTLSPALQNRMEKAVELYRAGLVEELLLSGDGQKASYDETKAMRKYALKQGVPGEHIRIDTGGLSTFQSLQRAQSLHGLKGTFIVSQPFHLPRAVWIARALGLDAQGVSAAPIGHMWFYETREFGAKIKDFYGALGVLMGALPDTLER